MLKLNKSSECSKSELDLFYVPPTQTAIEEGVYDDIQPHSSFNTSDVIRFDIVGDSAHFLNLAETEIHIIGRIIQRGCDLGIEAKTKLAPVNNFLHSLFSQINISINNQNVENTNSSYSIRSYLENLISFNKIEKISTLAGDLFIKDEATQFENFTVEEKTTASSITTIHPVNRGFLKRHEKTINEKSIQLQGKLHCDLFTMNHLMVNSTTITLTLKKNMPKFYLMGEPLTNKEYYFSFDDCFLRIRRQVISPSVMVAISRINEEFTYKYPIKRVVVKSFVIPESSVMVYIPKICDGILPRRVVVGLLKTTAYDGRFSENPFYFENLNLTSMSLKVNSKSLPNTNGLKFDFVKNIYLDGYKSICKLSRDLDISYDEYKDGYTLFAFDLNPDVSSCAHYSALSDGIIDLVFTKLEPHKLSYTCICYCEYDNIIELNKHRQPSFDYII
jgi:hypothetical protein